MKTFRIGGIHPEENKLTADSATTVAELPQQAVSVSYTHLTLPTKA